MKRILFFTLIILFDLGFAQVSTPYWGTSGITASGSYWLGTKNPYPLIFKVNNLEIARFSPGVSNSSGLRFAQLTNSTVSNSPLNVSPIGVDNNGEVIRISSLMASITSSLTITRLVTNTATAIPFNVDDNAAFGTVLHSTTVNNTRFTVTRNGKYVVFAQPQIERISNATAACIFWLRKNGTTAIANSAIRYQPGSNLNIAIPLFVTLDLMANDYIEIMCQTQDTNTYQLTNTAGSGSGSTQIPNTPAIIIDIKGFYN
ncbi:hypothetical protein U9K52_08450 [Chryseobacterium sp. MHB01]|uniref:hypothetical protein n=1 Tax=Chryseobacterium sp. MHB01 TaxID=3109433 RepID=UPI002AFDD7CA|nr:hypothetical protein [Chryseobacterium sp. MHB01]MEA1848938.1 hypothetical protein [Chryseobacterium sp. MHB01]